MSAGRYIGVSSCQNMKYIGFIYGDFCMLQTFLSTIIEFFSFIESLCFLVFFAVVILKPPIAVTVLNFYYLIKIPKEERAKKISLISAILTITVGLFDTCFYLGVCCDVTSAEQRNNSQKLWRWLYVFLKCI